MNTVNSSSIRVAIIEDNRFIRNGIEIILKAEKEFELVGSYPSCEDAFFYEEIRKAQIVLMDIMLPGISGIEGIKYLKKHLPGILIIVCTAYEDDKNIFEAIAAGAVGFISKKTPPRLLISTLKNVLNGGSPITPNVAGYIKTSFQKTQNGKYTKSGEELVDIENKILEKISIGNSYLTVASELSIKEEELFTAIRSIYSKLQSKLIKISI